MSRPEDTGPAEIFYNATESAKYTTNSRIIEIQAQMAERAIELLKLEEGYVLDIGCGSGLSGEALTAAGYDWVGLDISPEMLNVAKDREVDGDVLLNDMGQGFSFRPGVFDGCISISALQWLCNADKITDNPYKRLCRLFESLLQALARGARAVFQFYPANPQQLEMITQAAVKSGFLADILIDFPNSTRAKKYYMILYNGPVHSFAKVPALATEDEGKVKMFTKKFKKQQKRRGGKPAYKSKEWILAKKKRAKFVGHEVKHESKYTGRRRKPRF